VRLLNETIMDFPDLSNDSAPKEFFLPLLHGGRQGSLLGGTLYWSQTGTGTSTISADYADADFVKDPPNLVPAEFQMPDAAEEDSPWEFQDGSGGGIEIFWIRAKVAPGMRAEGAYSSFQCFATHLRLRVIPLSTNPAGVIRAHFRLMASS